MNRPKILKKQAKTMKTIFLAPDPDREGEAISWHLAHILSDGVIPIKRVFFNELTREAIKVAFENPRDIDQQLVDSQQARRLMDRIVGYELSPLLWKKVGRGLSAGRVQSVALRLIVEREHEIKKFILSISYDLFLTNIPPSDKNKIIQHEEDIKTQLGVSNFIGYAGKRGALNQALQEIFNKNKSEKYASTIELKSRKYNELFSNLGIDINSI